MTTTNHRDREAMTDPIARLKVMFIINSLTGGGAERVMTTLLARSAHLRDHADMSLVLLDEEAVAYPPPDWLPVHRLDCRFSTVKSLLRLRQLISRERPDVTLSFLTRANVANGFAMAGRGRPWIISERVNTDAQFARGLRALVSRALVRVAYPRAWRVIAVSQGVADSLVTEFGVRSDRVKVISNPVDVDNIRRLAEEPPHHRIEQPFVMAMGRLVKKKNFPMVLEAFASSGIGGRLVIAGEGPLREELQRRAVELGIADRLVMPGFLSNPYALLSRADVFAMSSNAEGFPNALVESLALGVPVVSTNCPDGPAEILAGLSRQQVAGYHVAQAGILTPPGDAQSFAKALQEIQEPQLRRRLIEHGRTRVEDYSPERAVSNYWDVINDVAVPASASSRQPGTAPTA